MTNDGGWGAKGVPLFGGGGSFEDWIDLGIVAAYAAKYGNRMVGTAAQRGALTTTLTAQDQRWDGLEFYETDTKLTWLCSGTSWIASDRWMPETPLGVDAGNFAKPAAGTPLISKTRYLKTALSNGVYTMAFETPFPNRCLYVAGTTIEGSTVNPVVNARGISASQVALIWPGAGSATVAAVVLAIGY